MTIHDVIQRSDDWHALRAGRLTASKSHDAIATTSKGWAASRANLMMQLALERVTGRAHDSGYKTQAMQDGIDREPQALALYEAMTGALVRAVGFCSHDTAMAGCSPDGFVGDDGLVSVKCPIPATHWEYLKTSEIPLPYQRQILHEFWITGRQWCDFFSYQPFFPERLQAQLIRVPRVEAEVEKYEKQALAFLAEVDTEVAAILTMSNHVAVMQAVL